MTIVMIMMTRLLGIIIVIICSITIIILVRSIVVIVIISGCHFVHVCEVVGLRQVARVELLLR